MGRRHRRARTKRAAIEPSPYRRSLRFEPLEDRRMLSITVDTTADVVDAGDGFTSLREAIATANATPGADTINFAPALTAGGPATILLTQGELAITDSLTINGPGAYLLTIDASGNDPTPTVKNGDGSRVFIIYDGLASLSNVTLNGLRLTGGDSLGQGGAIEVHENLTVQSCIVDGNATTATFDFLGGGAIYSGAVPQIQPSNSSLTVLDSIISNNLTIGVDAEGGGIRKSFGSLTVERTIISNNTSGGSGGGISAADSGIQVLIQDCVIRNNVSHATGSGVALGGGVYLDSAVATIVDTSVVGNSAARGGGIYAWEHSFPAANLKISNSTISGNTATTFTGGIYASIPATVSYSTIANNSLAAVGSRTAYSISVSSSIITGNGSNGPTGGFNLVNASSNGIIGPLFGSGAPIFLDGSLMPVHALVPGSAAIDAGKATDAAGVGGVPLYDQRGAPFSRVVDGDGKNGARIDIGAYERQTDDAPLSFVVDTLADQNGDDYSPGSRSLREAIMLANSHPGADTITFSPALTAAGPGTISLKYGEMAITEAVTITGPGANLLTIDAGQKSRIFNIDNPSQNFLTFDTSISAVTLTGGKTTGNNTNPNGGANHYLYSGGAIHSFSTGALALIDVTVQNSSTTGSSATGGGIFALGPITLAHSVVSGNSTAGRAAYGGGIAAAYRPQGSGPTTIVLTDSIVDGNQTNGDGNSPSGYAIGGGIWSYGSVTLTRTTISNNRLVFAPAIFGTPRVGGGGGVFSYKGSVTLTDSLVTGNFAAGLLRGGGVNASQGGVTLTRSAVSGNQAGYGGGVWGSTVTATASTISGNTTIGQGGGIYGLNVNLTSCTVSGNSVTGQFARGGGIVGNTASIFMSTIVDNHAFGANANGGGVAAAVNGRGSIIAGNSAGAIGQDVYGSCSLFFSLLGSNQVSATVSLPEAPVGSPDSHGNLIGGPVTGIIDPMLGPLVNNGGPTLTRALLPGSPAIDAGDSAAVAGVNGVPVFDERGTPWARIVGGRIDMGAVEAQANPLPGDYNFNGVVDAADYAVWRDTNGATNDLRADGSGAMFGVPDGVVDSRDYDFWMSQFGNVLPGAGSAATATTALAEDSPTSLTVVAPVSIDSPIHHRVAPTVQRFSVETARDDALLLFVAARTNVGPSQNAMGPDSMTDTAASAERDDHSIDAVDDVFASLAVSV